jgi:hypothetical protein
MRAKLVAVYLFRAALVAAALIWVGGGTVEGGVRWVAALTEIGLVAGFGMLWFPGLLMGLVVWWLFIRPLLRAARVSSHRLDQIAEWPMLLGAYVSSIAVGWEVAEAPTLADSGLEMLAHASLVLGVLAIALFGGEWALERIRPGTPDRPVRTGWHIGVDEEVDPEPAEEFWSPEPPVGWRGWMWRDGTLHGVRVPWPRPILEAECNLGCRPVPGWLCGCGIYATKDRWNAWRTPIIGKVALSGRVIEHEEGYRAARAEILELWVPAELAPAIRRRYPGVRIHERTEVRA